MKIIMYGTHSYDRESFAVANEDFAFKIEYLDCLLNPETARQAKGADAVCVFVNDCVDAATLNALKSFGVRTVALRCAGFNNVDLDEAKRTGIRVIRVPSYSPHSIAEHAVGLILNLSRKIHHADARVRNGNYSLEGLLGKEIFGSTVGVIGTGEIGSAFSKIMLGFGCRVIASDLVENSHLRGEKNFSYQSFESVLANSDILSLHAPLTSTTTHMINQHAFSRIKRGCMLINTGRGALINAVDLVEALKSGVISSAGLDVYEKEKDLFFSDQSDQILMDDVFARLLGFQNVIITPHQAFFTREALAEIARSTLDHLANGGINGPELCVS